MGCLMAKLLGPSAFYEYLNEYYVYFVVFTQLWTFPSASSSPS